MSASLVVAWYNARFVTLPSESEALIETDIVAGLVKFEPVVGATMLTVGGRLGTATVTLTTEEVAEIVRESKATAVRE